MNLRNARNLHFQAKGISIRSGGTMTVVEALSRLAAGEPIERVEAAAAAALQAARDKARDEWLNRSIRIAMVRAGL